MGFGLLFVPLVGGIQPYPRLTRIVTLPANPEIQ